MQLVGFVFFLLMAAASAWAQAPRIDAVSPAQGPISGGTIVTIRGANLSGAAVLVDRSPLAPLAQTASEIRLSMPRHESGVAVLTVRNSAGAGYGEYLYVPPRLQDLPPGHITTIAGIGFFLGDGRPATRAVVQPVDIAVAPDNSIYIPDQSYNRIRRIAPDGVISTVAGTGVHSISGDGGDGRLAIDADLRIPLGITLDAAGNLYIVDLSHRVRRVDAATGIITTIAGEPHRSGFSGDGGPASRALLHTPAQIAVDRDGTLYVLEQGNARVRRIAPDGTISTYAGTGIKGYSGDGGPAVAAQVDVGYGDDGGMDIDSEGNLYLAETHNGVIRKIEKRTGIITTVARIHNAGGVAVSGDGDLYILAQSDAERRRRIARVDSTGRLMETWGKGNGFAASGASAGDAAFGQTRDIALDAQGNILIAEAGTSRLLKIDRATGLISTLAGLGLDLLNEEGPAIATYLGWDLDGGDIDILPDGSLLIADNWRFRVIDRNGNIRTLARTREIASVPFPLIAFDFLPDGSIAFVDCGGVRKFTASGVQPGYIAGSGSGFAGDGGPATKASFSCPNDVAADRQGNLFVADLWNNRIRRIDAASGIITTVAGIGPAGGVDGFNTGAFCGDGGPAAAACLNTPWTVLVDDDGTVFIGDGFNESRIRKVDPSGRITTFVRGSGTPYLLDPGGNIYTMGFSVLSRFSPRGAFTDMAGGGQPRGFSGDGGAARMAQIGEGSGSFQGMAMDAEGNLYFRDGLRIRAIRYGAVLSPHGTTASPRGSATRSATLSRAMDPIEVVLRDSAGDPATHVRVDFRAPSSGASAIFENGQSTIHVVTDRNGVARVTPIADCRSGAYTITAVPLTTGDPTPLTVHINVTNQGTNAIPHIDRSVLSPATPGGPVTLQIHGRDFSPCTTALWNGSNRPARFVNPSVLEVTLQASDLSAATSGRITVSTPAPGGGVSNEIAINVPDGNALTPRDTLTFSIPSHGVVSRTTAGSGPLSVGYARMQPSAGGAPEGVAIFGYRSGGILVSEAGVPAERPLKSGRIYVQVSADRSVTTGIAIANPNNSAATIAFFFTNAAGMESGAGSIRIEANAQLAEFLDGPRFGPRPDFEGTFSFTSDIPIVAIALRGMTNQRGEFIMTTLPVVNVADFPSTGARMLPHFAAGGGWTTRFVLVNPTDSTISGQVSFGNPVTVDSRHNCCFSYSVLPRSAHTLVATGAADTATGSIRIVPDSGEASPVPLAIFSFTPAAITISEAAVTANTGAAFRVYVESRGAPENIETGIAVANTSTDPATVMFELFRLDGAFAGIPPATITLPVRGHAAAFVPQLFGTLPPFFEGVLRISANTNVSVAGLRGRYNERSEFLVTTVPPVNESALPSQAEAYFPHIASSGGYATQLILYGGSAGQTRSGQLLFFDQSGRPLAVPLR